jgi:membrane protein DedA with SNARE-associated domain
MVEVLLARFGYLAIVAALVAAGLGVPIPEELTQLTAGVLAHRGILSPLLAIAAAWLGIVLGDALLFEVARRHGPRALETRLGRRALGDRRREALRRHFARHAFVTIAVARHLSGLRLAVFALAATEGVSRRTFVLADGLSALVSVPLVVGVGWLFSRHVLGIERGLHRVDAALLGGAVAVAVAVWTARRVRARRSPPGEGARAAPGGPR